jgi:PAS domain S-box-containing protein
MSTIQPRATDCDLRLILDSVPGLVSTMTPTGVIDFANRQLLDYLGVSLEQIQDWPPFIHEADRAMVIEQWTHSVESGQPFEAEYRLRRSDGVHRWFHSHAVPVRAQDGSIQWYNLITDIEDRKQAEDLLQKSERRFRAIFDNIPALLGIIHPVAGELELVNQASLDYHNRTLAELKQWKTSDVVHPDDLAAEIAALERSFATGQPLVHEHRLRRADGVYRWFQLRAVRSQGRCDGIPRWYVLETDIHDRKMAEEALQRSEAFLLEVQRLSRTGGWRYDRATNVVESSPEIQRAYDVQPGEDISYPPFWFDRMHPDDRPRVQAQFDRCMREKAEYRAGYRIILPDGSIRYQYATGHPVTNDAGDLVEFIGASMDMTEHWLATTELERASQAVRDLQTRMSRAAQIATVGELAGSIAHEVNQPLAAIVANGHACLRWLSASPSNVSKAVEAVERIVKDGKDTGEVVRRVRALFQRAAVEKVQLDLGEVIGEVLRLIDSYPARKHVSLKALLDPELPLVYADRVQLQQLLLNLMLNALEALEPVNGRVKQLSVRSKRAEANLAAIQISDNGIGLDDPVTAFEPFVTTKPEGMGLGLAICRSIVAAHDGRLSAERNAGFGMTFTVTLPIHPEA